jgi:hypothetical protein
MQGDLIVFILYDSIRNHNDEFSLHFNPLNAELNLICHLLALLGDHHFLYVSRVRVNPMRLIFMNYNV